eukprot:3934049-Rhodomonas_salina.2
MVLHGVWYGDTVWCYAVRVAELGYDATRCAVPQGEWGGRRRRRRSEVSPTLCPVLTYRMLLRHARYWATAVCGTELGYGATGEGGGDVEMAHVGKRGEVWSYAMLLCYDPKIWYYAMILCYDPML